MANTPDPIPSLDLTAEANAEGPIGETVVLDTPKRPDITPAQLVAGIPIIAELGHAFGIFALSAPQQDSLSKAVMWAFALIGGDALIRLGRNIARR